MTPDILGMSLTAAASCTDNGVTSLCMLKTGFVIMVVESGAPAGVQLGLTEHLTAVGVRRETHCWRGTGTERSGEKLSSQ